jgi:YHS domain-containing protein
MWLRSILIFLLVLFLVRFVLRLVRGIVEGATSPSGASPHRPAHPPAVKMVADPVCGTFVVPGKALQLARGRETVYFCSDKCRDEWVRAH